jgi:hypothetical protein
MGSDTEGANELMKSDKATEIKFKSDHGVPYESSINFAGDGIKVTTTGKLSYKVDVHKLDELTAAWTPDLKPLKVEVKADETKLKKIRRDNPTLWKTIAGAVTITPQKTGVSIEIEAQP